MYDDASYYSFAPSTQPQSERIQISKHKRRQSLLKQPNVSLGLLGSTSTMSDKIQEDVQADARLTDGNPNIIEADEAPKGPPKATISRRAQSYSDFHDAVRAILGRDATPTKDTQHGEGNKLETELDFVDWYHNLEHGLLDASQDEYT